MKDSLNRFAAVVSILLSHFRDSRLKTSLCGSLSAVGLTVSLTCCLETNALFAQAPDPSSYYMQTFSVYRFFWNSPDPETISEEAAREARSQIAAAVDQKRSIMGNTTVWVFPPFANAPTVPPPTPIPLEYSKRVPKQFVPPFDSPEYQRLSDVRNRMLATLVRSFPEVQYWVIGYEDSLEFFYEPDGAKLRTERLVRFAVDALEASYQVIKHENPSAIVVGHFLGSPTSPIKIADEIIQPADLSPCSLPKWPPVASPHPFSMTYGLPSLILRCSWYEMRSSRSVLTLTVPQAPVRQRLQTEEPGAVARVLPSNQRLWETAEGSGTPPERHFVRRGGRH